MSKGENIFKRKDGRWEARYIRGYELSGKIRYGFCYGKTYKEAKEKVTKFKAAMVGGSPLPDVGSRHRFAFYCDEWLRLRKAKLKEATYIKYDTALEKHIKPKLGGCFPLGLSTGLIDDFTRELLLEDEVDAALPDVAGFDEEVAVGHHLKAVFGVKGNSTGAEGKFDVGFDAVAKLQHGARFKNCHDKFPPMYK